MTKRANPLDEAPQPDAPQIEPHTAGNEKPERYDPQRDLDVLLSGNSLATFIKHERLTNERLKLAEENERLKLAEENERLKPERRKKDALIRELESRLPSIKSDLRHADENGLKAAAKLERGYWNMTAALQWAKENGKLTDSASRELNSLEVLNRLSMNKRER